MTKIISSKYKASRRLGVSLWGDSKDAFLKKNYRPGQHGQSSSLTKNSDYGLHLKAKQRLKNHYGRISEKQFRNTFKLASKMKGNTGENLVALLEKRLDAIIYRLNLAPTPFSARQLVSHGHIKVNGKKVDIASQRLKEGDIIELKDSSKQIPLIVGSISKNTRSVPVYLDFDATKYVGKFLRNPTSSEVPYPFVPDIHLVVELYSR